MILQRYFALSSRSARRFKPRSRAAVEAWNAGDMDAFREMHDPDVILRTVGDWPEQGPHVGREAVMRFFDQLRDTWDAGTLAVSGEPIDVADRVVVRFNWHVQGHGSQWDLEVTSVSTIRNGRDHPAHGLRRPALPGGGLRSE